MCVRESYEQYDCRNGVPLQFKIPISYHIFFFKRSRRSEPIPIDQCGQTKYLLGNPTRTPFRECFPYSIPSTLFVTKYKLTEQIEQTQISKEHVWCKVCKLLRTNHQTKQLVECISAEHLYKKVTLDWEESLFFWVIRGLILVI